MVREVLKIYTDKGLGNNNPTFHDIEIEEYEYKGNRMGMPELSATLMWDTCLDDEWTNKEYVTLNQGRYFIRHTPSSSKSNDDERYKHELVFSSEDSEILANTFFVDAVYAHAKTKDKPCSNNTKFTFFGTIGEFCDRLNCAFLYAGIGDSVLKTKTSLTAEDKVSGDGFCVAVDEFGDYDREKSYEFSFEDVKLWDAITNGYNTTEIPFERRGKRFVFGAVPTVVDHVFEYGYDNELLSVNHNNANAQVINRITMVGSSENIPYQYPNETEYGHINIAVKPDNKVLTRDMIELINATPLLSNIREGEYAVLKSKQYTAGSIQTDDFLIGFQFDDESFEMKPHKLNDVTNYYRQFRFDPTAIGHEMWWHIAVNFTVKEEGYFECNRILGRVWEQGVSQPADGATMMSAVEPLALMAGGAEGRDISHQINKYEDSVSFGNLSAGKYYFHFRVPLNPKANINVWYWEAPYSLDFYVWLSYLNIQPDYSTVWTELYWQVGSKKFSGEGSLGVKINRAATDAMLGDGFGWVASDRINTQDGLMPPKYRETGGAERFYNAENGKYIDPDTGKPYVFENPFIEGAPSEHIYRNEDIKPTIEGVRNAQIQSDGLGQLFGEIADVAYDLDDNDFLQSDSADSDKNDSSKYQHSFFYIKLNIFNGAYGFDLFAHASQTDAMTLQMRSGSCNGCKFKIQALEYEDSKGLKTYKNPVQTLAPDGDIVAGGYGDKVRQNWQEWQQDTSKNSIWICVQKDADTFGVIMPNRTNNFLPKKGDRFNIINIDLPQGYVLAAEKRLEEEGIRFMADNNEEKFTFSIQASRIFFAENPDVLSKLDEYSKIKVRYNGRIYEQYINQLSISCKDSEALPDIGIELTDNLAVSQTFVDRVSERASSIIENAMTLGGYLGGGGGGLSPALAERRYLNKMKADRTPYKLSSDTAFEVGEFVSGGSGAILMRDAETGQTYLEVDKLRVRLKAIFEELEISKVTSIGGKQIITPGGSILISYVEELSDSYKCYFKTKDEDKGVDCKFIVGDQVQCQEFNISNGYAQQASNRYYWRLVTVVNNEEGYIELSKSDCDKGSDAPMAGDVIVQLGNRNNSERRSAIIHSTVDAFAPCVTLYDGIGEGSKLSEWYSLEDKEMVEYGVDKTKNPPRPFFHCYGDAFIGDRDKKWYLDLNPDGLDIKGNINSLSTIDGGTALSDYVKNISDKAAQDALADIDNENLLRNAGFLEFNNSPKAKYEIRLPYWTCDQQGVVVADEFDGGDNAVLVNTINDTDAATAYRGFYQTFDSTDSTKWNYLPLNEGDTFTASIWTRIWWNNESEKPKEGEMYLECRGFDESGGIVFAGEISVVPEYSGQWQRFTVTSVLSKKCKTFHFKIYQTGRFAAYYAHPKLETGRNATEWSASPKDTNYLQTALQNGGIVSAGLFLGSMITLGNKTDNGFEIMSGMNGIYNQDAAGCGLAFWAGGNPGASLNEENTTFGIRMDGTGYFANHTIRFSNNGVVELGENLVLSPQALTMTIDDEDLVRISNTKLPVDLTNLAKTASSLEEKQSKEVYMDGDHGLADGEGNDVFMIGDFRLSGYQPNVVGGITINIKLEIFQLPQDWEGPLANIRVFGIDGWDEQSLVLNRISNVLYEAKLFLPIVTSSNEMRIRIEFVSDMPLQGEIPLINNGSITTSYAFTAKSFGERMTLIGNDGFISSWDKTVLGVNQSMTIMRAGNYGLLIDADNGIKVMTDGSNWRNANI